MLPLDEAKGNADAERFISPVSKPDTGIFILRIF